MVFRSSFGKWLNGITFLVLLWALSLNCLEVSFLAAVSPLPAAALIGYWIYLLFWVPGVWVAENNVLIRDILFQIHRVVRSDSEI